jgi:hypothetical protein
MNIEHSTITITFGDVAENHAGMEQLGELVPFGEGFDLDDLLEIQQKFDSCDTVLYDLSLDDIEDCNRSVGAYFLLIKNGVSQILSGLDYTVEDFFKEQSDLEFDKKAFMYGRVVNKHARWNLCFDDFDRDPDYASQKGRVVSFESVPITNIIYRSLPVYFGDKAKGLKGEGNYYYDVKKCGIGFHGDAERRKVIGVRLGASMPLHYQWYYDGKPVGERIVFSLNGGDIYIMSEKAVGTDWKKKKIYTLRHAAGCEKFTC